VPSSLETFPIFGITFWCTRRCTAARVGPGGRDSGLCHHRRIEDLAAVSGAVADVLIPVLRPVVLIRLMHVILAGIEQCNDIQAQAVRPRVVCIHVQILPMPPDRVQENPIVTGRAVGIIGRQVTQVGLPG